MTVLSDLSVRLEEVTDAAAEAFDAEAEAENAYLSAFSAAWAVATEDKVAISARSKHVDADPEVTQAHMDWNRAIAARKRCVAKVEEVRNRLVACQSHMRFVRDQT